MRLANPSLFSSYRWYEWAPLTTITQHPTMWRFLAYGYFRGTASLGIPSLTEWTAGYGVFDWDYVKNRYELTRFAELPDYWSYQPYQGSTCFAWVNDTDIRVIGGSADTSDMVRHAAKFSVSAAGVFTWSEPSSTACGYDSIGNATFSSGWAIGYSGAAIYPYGDGAGPSSNCYVGKLTATNSATNLGPLRSGLSSGGTNAPLCPLGPSAAGNGYALGVQYCSGDDTASTIYAAIYNVGAATPSLQASLSFSGKPNSLGAVHIGARKAVLGEAAGGLRAMLLYSNSDTSPTTLTLGSTTTMPTLPFRSADIGSALLFGASMNAQNCWVSEGKGVAFAAYNVNQNFAAGETQRYYMIPCKVLSPGVSDLSVSILSTDINGDAVPLDTWFYSNLAPTQLASFQLVGAPGSKAAMIWRLGLYEDSNQTIFQL